MGRRKKTFRNPNGYGSVVYLGKGRRNPWAVRVTVDTVEAPELKLGYRQIKKTIGYTSSREEGMYLLAKYNENRSYYDNKEEMYKFTFKDVFEKWKVNYYNNISDSSQNGYNFAFNHCIEIHDISFASLRLIHIQDIFDKKSTTLSKDSLIKIKTLIRLLYTYAGEHEIVEKDYSVYIKLPKQEPKKNIHTIFTIAEINILFENINIQWVDAILIMIYTGLRVGGLLALENKNINLNEGWLRGGIKTDAGKDRLIPIHHSIHDLISKRYDPEQKYLFHTNHGTQLAYKYYREYCFDRVLKGLGMNHLPHDCRHTFATLLDNAEANQTSVKKLIGHSSYVTTQKTYTHKDVEELRKAIEKL